MSNVHDALFNLRGMLCVMIDTVDAAIGGDEKALQLIIEEYGDHGCSRSHIGGRVHDVARAVQDAEDEAANAAYEKWLEAEEAIRVRQSERA